MNLNYHQELWDNSQASELTEQEKRALQLSAAIFGHYRAFSAAKPSEQKALTTIWKINKDYQGYKEYLYTTNQIEEAQKVEEAIDLKKKALMDNIVHAAKMGLLDEHLETLTNSNISDKLDIGTPPFKYYLYVMQHSMQQFTSWSVLGSNRFLSRSPESRKRFSDSLNKQESLDRLYFEEHKAENKEHNIIEFLKISNEKAPSMPQKNIIIWFGGRESNYAYATDKLLTQTVNMKDVHEVWQVNHRRTSLASNGLYANYDNLYEDAETAYEYIRASNPDANITIAGYCAGSPMACHVASKYNEKFFSDRSFTGINDVVTVQLSPSYEGDAFLAILFALPHILYYAVHTILCTISALLLYCYHLNPHQNEMIKNIPQEKRLLHVISPKTNKTMQQQDSLTLGTNASLHKAQHIQDAEKEFDQKFITACKSLLPENINIDAYIDELANNDPKKAHKTALLIFCKPHITANEYQLLKRILIWHKNRKSFIQSDQHNTDPHIAYSTLLSGRGDPNTNFIDQVNVFASITNQELENPTVFVPNNHTIDSLCQSVKPFAIYLQKNQPSLLSEVSESKRITQPASTHTAKVESRFWI